MPREEGTIEPRNSVDHIMLAKLNTFSLLGIDALPVEVEVDVSPAGLPKTVLVGLSEAALKQNTHGCRATWAQVVCD